MLIKIKIFSLSKVIKKYTKNIYRLIITIGLGQKKIFIEKKKKLKELTKFPFSS